ncbi:hypothetical protein QBC46DRAFT_383995 [Diplogelasinospora grovesii]|uniref:Uncharacterized protein n=1 Tax=Diplogelasinospora grovesii TaxID=303347 RepID=A0AAN6S572_9PEZI|nr:hypothetical protein QBC46DRAFT_383995 [Diplogelasinospora grovesii]
MARAEKDIPIEERKKGFLGRLGKKIIGESSEEFAARHAYVRDVELRRAQRIEQARKQRDDERKDAERALADARKFEEGLRNKIRKNTADLKRNNRDRLASAKASLEKTRSQFNRLASEKIKLVSGSPLKFSTAYMYLLLAGEIWYIY